MQGKVPSYCLKSDIEFADHEKYSENRSDSEICEESYDFKKIQRAFAPNRLDKIKQSVKTAIENQNLKGRGKQAVEKIKNKFSKNQISASYQGERFVVDSGLEENKESKKEKIEEDPKLSSEIEMENGIDTTKTLVVYQPSRLSRILNVIMNKMRSFFNKFSNKKEKNPAIEEMVESNSEKMPFWDLRNWSPEELQTFVDTPLPQDHMQDKSVKLEEKGKE